VIAVPDPRWQERPLGVAVLKESENATQEELIEHLAGSGFAKWQLPDAIEFVEEIPRTATGKFLKMKLREQFQDYTPA
jgi:fatty-acyl-CoA synthase